ncbi:MAG TPA: hypothetical protein VOA87_09340 [Thermoanaerobaculia bacterium]|nr:hypothetical protein [Thermoanaerobaculia bacterium]
MAQISRPFQIALVAFGLLVAVWFFALHGHSSTSSSGSTPATPAAPAAPAAPSAAAQTGKAAAPSGVYHGSAPGVSGLTRAIEKAHGAVATSQQNAKQLQEKSAQASSASPGGAASPASPAAKAPASTHAGATATAAPKAPAAASTQATRAAGQSKAAEARTGPQGIPARQALVERALKEGRIAVILFWNSKGTDDVSVMKELRLLEAVHRLIRPVAGTPAERRVLSGSGLEVDKKFATFVAPANQVTSFGSITRGVQVFGTPTLLVINKSGQVTKLTGLTDAYAIEQTIDEARRF